MRKKGIYTSVNMMVVIIICSLIIVTFIFLFASQDYPNSCIEVDGVCKEAKDCIGIATSFSCADSYTLHDGDAGSYTTGVNQVCCMSS